LASCVESQFSFKSDGLTNLHLCFTSADPTEVGDAKRKKAMPRNFKVLLIAMLVIVIAGGSYAFAAANVVPDTAAGYKANVVSGYTVTNIVYDLNTLDPTLVDKITFSVSPTSGDVPAATVKVQTAGGGSWKGCTLVAGTAPAMSVTCTYSSPTLSLDAITALNIVASSTSDPS
jgi:hypothetical protein